MSSENVATGTSTYRPLVIGDGLKLLGKCLASSFPEQFFHANTVFDQFEISVPSGVQVVCRKDAYIPGEASTLRYTINFRVPDSMGIEPNQKSLVVCLRNPSENHIDNWQGMLTGIKRLYDKPTWVCAEVGIDGSRSNH